MRQVNNGLKPAAATLALALMGTGAHAQISSVGSPFPHGSWGQQFNESGVGAFDHIQMIWVSGALLEVPISLTNFSDGSWMQTFNNGLIAVADGNSLASLNFDVIYSGLPSAPNSYCFQAFNGNTIVDDALVEWTGSGFNITGPSGCPTDRIIPAPGAMALLSLGGLVSTRRRR